MKDFFYRLIHNKLAVTGGVILILFILMAVLAPVIAPYDTYYMDASGTLSPPSA